MSIVLLVENQETAHEETNVDSISRRILYSRL